MDSRIAIAIGALPTVLILLIIAYTIGWTKGWDEASRLNKKYIDGLASFAKCKLLELADLKMQSLGQQPDLCVSFIRIGAELSQIGIHETITIRSDKLQKRIAHELSRDPRFATLKSVELLTTGPVFVFEKEVKPVVED